MGLTPFLDWVGALPLSALYLILAAIAAAENVFPPLPADTVVAFGSFLAARGHGSPWIVLLVVWVGNVAGAMVVYALGRRYGAARLEKRMFGKRAEQFEARLSDYYGRFGLAALFLGRFIPGVRALVPPFAGALRVPVLTAGLLIGSASAIWYSVVSYAGFTLGADWPTLIHALSRDGWTAAGVAAVLLLATAAVILVRRRTR